jgi:hypothetical protein
MAVYTLASPGNKDWEIPAADVACDALTGKPLNTKPKMRTVILTTPKSASSQIVEKVNRASYKSSTAPIFHASNELENSSRLLWSWCNLDDNNIKYKSLTTDYELIRCIGILPGFVIIDKC